MIYPNFIKKGDCIGVPAPSNGAYDEPHVNRFVNSRRKLEDMGFKIVLSKNINKSDKCRSASAEERADEVNNMFADEKIDMIICAAGGEFLVEMLPYVDFESIKKHPKFVQGFSDPTGLMFAITTKYDIATIYGNNFGEYGANVYDRSVLDSLEVMQGNLIEQENYEMYENEGTKYVTGLEGYNFTDKVEWKVLNDKKTVIKGRIIGGCLDLIAELAGTKYDGTSEFIERYKNDGIIWYFDNCELSMEELIRTFWKLNELGFFKYTNGILLGRSGNNNSFLGYSIKEVLEDSVISKLGFPIIYDADISHKGPCLTIINGAIATVSCEGNKGKISFELKI